MNKHRIAETDAPKPTCPVCGTNDRKLAECSTCEVWFCAGECFSLHREPAKPVRATKPRPLIRITARPWLARILVAAGAQRGRDES